MTFWLVVQIISFRMAITLFHQTFSDSSHGLLIRWSVRECPATRFQQSPFYSSFRFSVRERLPRTSYNRRFIPRPDYQFENGCHAPPWRQVHGDISYLDVKPSDGDALTVTASTSGYFVNKYKSTEEESRYERESEVYPTLVALLKAKSAHFCTTIDKKVGAEDWGRMGRLVWLTACRWLWW